MNPHKRLGRTLAILCFALTGMLLFCGTFFVVTAATVDLTTLPLRNVTNVQLAILTAATALIPALVALLMGYQIWRLWGGEQAQPKTGPRTAVSCLLTSSLGCGLWAILSATMSLLTGTLLTFNTSGMTDRAVSVQEILVGQSGSLIFILVILLIANYIWRFHVRLQPAEQEQIQIAYFADLALQSTQMDSREYKAYAQRQTVWLLPQIDAARKQAVVKYLYDAGLLRGHEAMQLSGANLKQVDLQKLELPNLNLQGADLQGANLQNSNFARANFHKANLRKANCSYSNFNQANLWAADLRQGNLTGVDFKEANLTAAKITAAQLKAVRSLENALMPDSTRYRPQV